MAEPTVEEITEGIEAVMLELREVAQPHEIAQLYDLVNDAAQAQTPEQLRQIATQVKSLRAFCLSRTKSSGSYATPPRNRKRA
jgi:hypothetical protein